MARHRKGGSKRPGEEGQCVRQPDKMIRTRVTDKWIRFDGGRLWKLYCHTCLPSGTPLKGLTCRDFSRTIGLPGSSRTSNTCTAV